jgi:hypothetical protein
LIVRALAALDADGLHVDHTAFGIDFVERARRDLA